MLSVEQTKNKMTKTEISESHLKDLVLSYVLKGTNYNEADYEGFFYINEEGIPVYVVALIQ